MSKVNVLLVDDSPTNHLLLEVYLKGSQFTLTIAENGEKGLVKFKEGHFDLILMDVMMPVMDGLEATRQIRKLESASGNEPTPILILSGSDSPAELSRAREAGCTDFLAKPYPKEIFLKKVRELTG